MEQSMVSCRLYLKPDHSIVECSSALGRAGSKRAKEGEDGVAGEARAAATRARSVLARVEPAKPWRVGPANISISP